MKRTNRILSMLLAVLMVVCMLPVSVFAADSCICDTKCTDTANADCPVCSGDGAVLAEVCNGQAADTTKYLVFVTDAPLDGSGGTVTGEGEYAPGDQVTVSIVPNKAGGYCAAQWASADLGMSPIPAFNQQTSHTFTMPAQNVEISITFVNHELKFYRSLENKTHVAYCLQCNEESDTPEDCIDEVGGADELGPPDERCDKCGYDWHVHSFVAAYGSNDTHHWRSCSACGDEQVDYTPHTYGTAWSFDETNHYHACVCGKQTDAAPHSMATDWTSDEEGHGHFCSCGATFDFEEHNPGPAATETTAQTCIDCGYEIAPALGHQHTHSTEWWKDEHGHWHGCECGDMPDFAEHTSSGAASYGIPETCTVCRYEIAPALTGYTLTLDYSIVTESGVEIGTSISDQIVGCPAGDVVDLSGYWRDDSLEVTGSDGKTYYFGGFVENSNGNGILLYSATMNSNKTLYANWVFDKQITVILDTVGGVLPYKKTRIAEKYAEISEMNSLHKPVRAGYDFVGWSVENDGIADSGDTYISDGWPIYAVWQTYMPSYDDNWNPPAPGTPVEIGGDYDAVRISDGVIGKIIDNGNEVVVKFPDGTSGTLTDSALVAAKENLQDGESLQIAIKNAGSEVLPDSLTEKGPYGGSEAAIDKSIFKATGIENIEDRLKTLGLINGNTDSSVTEDEFEYLYHYLTTDELTALKNELNESAHFEHHQNAVNWLTEMIERDAVKPLNMQELMNMANLTDEQFESLADMELNDPTIGQLRQAGFTLEQMKLLQSEAKKLSKGEASAETQAKYDALLAWLDDAIAQKELEKENATITSMTVYGLKEYADLTDKQMKILSDMGLQNLDNPSVGQIKKLDLTLEQMELLYAEIDRARSAEYNPEYQAEYDVLLKWLEKAIAEKEQENTDTPTYINVSGTNDGINPIFIGAVDVNIGAVKADGTTTPIAIKADRSDAVAWSTNIGSAALEEMLAMLGAATTEDVVSNIKAYKVLDNGTLEAKASKVTVNADGTLTLSAMSNGNSLYIFVLEPEKAPAEEEEAVPTETEPEVPPTTPEPEQTATVPVEQPGDDPDSTPSGWIIAIIAAAVAVIGGGAAWVICRKKRRTN